MGSSGTELTLYGFLAATAAYGIFGARLIATGYAYVRASRAQRALAAAVGASAIWAAFGAYQTATGVIWSAVAVISFDLLRYGAWFYFLLELLRPGLPARRDAEVGFLRPVAVVLVGLGVAVLLALLSGRFDEELMARLLLLSSMAQPVLGLVLTEQLFRNIPEEGRWSVKPLCIGLAGLFIFDLYIYSQAVLFGTFDRDAFSVRAIVHALAVPLIFVASRRQADWRARLQVSHNAAFFSATLLLAGGYLLLISAIGYYVRFFGGDWGRALQLALLAGALLFLMLLVLSGTLRAKLRVFVGKNFFAYRYDYREQWLRFTATLSTQGPPQAMGHLVIHALAELVESPGGSLWLLGPGDSEFVQNAHEQLNIGAQREPADSAFAAYLRQQGWIVDMDEVRAHPDRYPGLVLPVWADAGSGIWAVVPLIVGERLTGFVLLARPRASTELNWEVRDLLKTASRQAAGFLAQMHATEALLEARKFDAFNRMSAFVVHDLKNIVTQLSLMMKNAKRLHDNPEFRQDMLTTVENSLEKMRQLMLQLREGEKPPGGQLGVELVPIVRRIAAVAQQRGRSLELSALEELATRGHDERVERVIGHVVQNAFDATPIDGRVWLSLTRDSGLARIEVGDTGQGMTREFIESRLFKPFSSTKASGMGIGSYESFQYIRELGGKIHVDSEPGRGTVITIRLPLFESRRESDLQMAETR